MSRSNPTGLSFRSIFKTDNLENDFARQMKILSVLPLKLSNWNRFRGWCDKCDISFITFIHTEIYKFTKLVKYVKLVCIKGRRKLSCPSKMVRNR